MGAMRPFPASAELRQTDSVESAMTGRCGEAGASVRRAAFASRGCAAASRRSAADAMDRRRWNRPRGPRCDIRSRRRSVAHAPLEQAARHSARSQPLFERARQDFLQLLKRCEILAADCGVERRLYKVVAWNVSRVHRLHRGAARVRIHGVLRHAPSPSTGWASQVDVVTWTADAGTVPPDIGLSDQRNKAQNAREIRGHPHKLGPRAEGLVRVPSACCASVRQFADHGVACYVLVQQRLAGATCGRPEPAPDA